MPNSIKKVFSVEEEYSYLNQHFGKHSLDWTLLRQDLINEGEKKYDRLKILLKDKNIIEVTFDVTQLFSKEKGDY
jgi:hypothetical protein